MPEINFQVKPVAVKAFASPVEDLQYKVNVFRGLSYCEAVNKAISNEELLVLSDSIHTCQWSPVVLGLKEPENSFENRLKPRMEKMWGYYISSLLSIYKRGYEPDIVLLIGSPRFLQLVLSQIGWNNCALHLAGELDKSALHLLKEERFSFKSSLTVGFNRMVFSLSGSEWWNQFTQKLLSSPLACNIFDRFISSFMSDMSVCRNSTAIPYQTGLINASHFCSGGIGWGTNYPEYMIAGIPFYLFRILREQTKVRWQATSEDVLEREKVPSRNWGC